MIWNNWPWKKDMIPQNMASKNSDLTVPVCSVRTDRKMCLRVNEKF